MPQTLCEKILARAAGKEKVVPGECIVVKDFVGPILYSYKGVDHPADVEANMRRLGLNKIAKPECAIYNEDHNAPPKNMNDSIFFKKSAETAKRLGMKCYCREGIGHVVNAEEGDIVPGKVFIHFDPQAENAGGVGAFYTNGGRYGSTMMEAFALGTITVCVPKTIKVIIDGILAPNISGKDIWFTVQNDIGPDGAIGSIIEFDGSAIENLDIDQRMMMCGNVAYTGAEGAIIKSDKKTQEWYKELSGKDVEAICGDEGAEYSKIYRYKAEDIVPMVTYPPEVFTSKPAKEFSKVKVDQCLMGTCIGGSINDLRIAAKIIKGKKVHEDVRFIISPVTQRTYVKAAKEGLLGTLAEAGAMILPPTCEVCFGGVGPLAPGEVGISQQTLNVPGRSGSNKAYIYLASAATITATAITGYITSPDEL